MRIFLICFLIFMFHDVKSQNTKVSGIYKSSKYGITFRYPSNWVPQKSQLNSTLILLYENKGTQSTCNLSVINKDMDVIEDYNSDYLLYNFKKVYPSLKNITNKIEYHLGYKVSVSTFESKMSLVNKEIDMKSFVVIILKNDLRYMLVINSPLDSFNRIIDDVNLIYGSLTFDNTIN